ncbi:pSer/pThr/pTyr-binding forkhead associated (FHA) protein [Labedella gwakjiensis]|uniref:FHA domain-containing protein n=1 Tax=Labedella gwakjiensis TaxID=390269 RepID=A0A2P8GVP3_9MICO|nr:FHA domain-containing protein [Labedella gwakjiensis]PSL38026.1 pSer/pThr/pTyr-binding forkhead associated (FHA) protein [Labedella gwakjiensis]RUQ87413.1 FHA domain-containing protein [Labedella gwakjiensis]
MSELTLLVLRFGFLILLWLFVLGVVYALRADLFGRGNRKPAAANGAASAPAPAPAPARPATARPAQAPSSPTAPTAAVNRSRTGFATAANARRLVIVQGPREGQEIPLGTGPLTIGRSADSSLVFRDDYTSTHHARLLQWNEEWMIQDLGSTNGTFLDGKRIGSPTQVPLNTPIKVGQTVFELRG